MSIRAITNQKETFPEKYASPTLSLVITRIACLILLSGFIATAAIAYFHLHHMPLFYAMTASTIFSLVGLALTYCKSISQSTVLSKETCESIIFSNNSYVGDKAIEALQKLPHCQYDHIGIAALNEGLSTVFFEEDGVLRHFPYLSEKRPLTILIAKDGSCNYSPAYVDNLKYVQPELKKYMDNGNKILIMNYDEYLILLGESKFPPHIIEELCG